MWGRVAIVALAVMGTGCAGVESAGRNAQRGESGASSGGAPYSAPAPVASPRVQAEPAPAPVQSAPPPQARAAAPAPQASVAAPQVAAPPPPPQERQRTQASNGDLVVPGEVQRQVQPPQGDPRTVAERMADIRAWDRCVMEVQAQGESDPTRPQLDMPEDLCAGQLGMANRLAVPHSRRQPR